MVNVFPLRGNWLVPCEEHEAEGSVGSIETPRAVRPTTLTCLYTCFIMS